MIYLPRMKERKKEEKEKSSTYILSYLSSQLEIHVLKTYYTYFNFYPASITGDPTPLPPPAVTSEADEELFAQDAWVEAPIHIDYGTNLELGKNVFINFNCTILDTCKVTIGARTLLASNVSLYSGTHPLDPDVRNGTQGPEMGGEIHIGEDCWLGGNVIVLPGVTIGRGCTIGAGSVVTKVGGILPIGDGIKFELDLSRKLMH